MSARLKLPLCGDCEEGWIVDIETGLPIRRCPCRSGATPTEAKLAGQAIAATHSTGQFQAAVLIIRDAAKAYTEFSANDIRHLFEFAQITNRNVIGSAFTAVATLGEIESSGRTVRSTDKATHAHPITLWRSLAYSVAAS